MKEIHPLSSYQKYYAQDFSDEELARDWTLSPGDKTEVSKYQPEYQAFIATQICALRIYGVFLTHLTSLSPRIVNYLNRQLKLPPSLGITISQRKMTYHQHLRRIMRYLGFKKFTETAQKELTAWISQQAQQGRLPAELLGQVSSFLVARRILLPGASVIKRLVNRTCAKVHEGVFKKLYDQLTDALKSAIDQLLTMPEHQQRSWFSQLKEYPPSATISALKRYLERYQMLVDTGIHQFDEHAISSSLISYLFKLSKTYKVTYMNRFKDHKRYAMMICFLIESRKVLLDHLVRMHDQYLTEIGRQAKYRYEIQHRKVRKRQKKAVDTMLEVGYIITQCQEAETPIQAIWQAVDKAKFHEAMEDLGMFKQLEQHGYGTLLLNRYPSLRKYFPQFIKLPFASEPGSEALISAIKLLRQLNANQIKCLPPDAPTSFVAKELRGILYDEHKTINRNAWEMGLAFAIKDALRSGDLYLPQSREHVSFWKLVFNERTWLENKEAAFKLLDQPPPEHVKSFLTDKLTQSSQQATARFGQDAFAQIQNGKLTLKAYERLEVPSTVEQLQRVLEASLPAIRIEQLLMEVDRHTRFSAHFVPLQQHQSRPPHFYKTLMAAILSQATNLGVIAMGASVEGISVDMLRHVLYSFINEQTLKNASAAIVDHHHQLPLSSLHGLGTVSSSDAQRFKIRADSLLASYYPRYYGYYDKAIGLYTHVSDQYTVFQTQVISCSPREALYVLDGLLENNTILKLKEHTTDTHGYTEIIFALCYLLGFYFMPRIRDLKDQQLYRVEKQGNYGVFTPLLSKTVDLELIKEQWESMIHVAISLKHRTSPAHLIVQRLTSSSPSDRLSKAFTNLGRIIKTEYILNYLSDASLRRKVHRQLNKGESRHGLARWIFFANQGAFTTGDYEEIMNKASCLSLVSNAILYWNTVQINQIIESIYNRGERIDQEALSHISLLPFKHVLPNGTYFARDT